MGNENKKEKNMIRFNGTYCNLDHVANDKDLNRVVDTTCNILASCLIFGSSGIENEEKRSEFILERAAKLASEIAKKAIFILANQPKEGGGDA